ncbi:hypothetical protein ElyMa_005490300 [Elysia marginata]|uniref:Uncharacterized protein n=1 Tax=Elysia marginata TaxID=1093978 RepID=A0AAV4ERV5_9GAST|nr:hypothetical protein ElyMa_005490300 [Elysia marginata]
MKLTTQDIIKIDPWAIIAANNSLQRDSLMTSNVEVTENEPVCRSVDKSRIVARINLTLWLKIMPRDSRSLQRLPVLMNSVYAFFIYGTDSGCDWVRILMDIR